MRCDYATCKTEAIVREEGWWFCAQHLREHYALRREEAKADTPRRCWWCGAWALALNDCDACTSPAIKPRTVRKEDTA